MKVAENDRTTILHSTSNELSSLLQSISQVQTFKGKWSLIKSKLHTLQSQLLDLSDFPNFSSNPLSLDLLRSISATLTDAVSLSSKCQTPNLSDGKLQTQSEIDFVLAKLDQILKDGEVLIKSGVLQDSAFFGGPNSSSISVVASKREAVRVESRNLITRLQVGTPESKHVAMDSLLGLICEDDKNVLIAVAQGVVPVLVKLLDSSSLEMKEKTVSAIARVSMVDSTKNVLIAEGLFLLNHLLRMLDSGSGFAKEKACLALRTLSFSRENARAIVSRGGISSLLDICQAGTPGSQAVAAGVLRNLAAFEETRDNFIEESAVSILLGLAASGTVTAQENAIGCLGNLVSGDENLKILVIREGGVECLMNFWDGEPPIRSLEVAVDLLKNLATSPQVGEVLVSKGFISRVAGVLNCGVLGVRIAAAKAVFELGFSTKTRKEIGECGCVSNLIKMLDGKASEEKEAAAKALSSLMLYVGNRRIFQKEERGIVSAVQLLDPLVQNSDKKYPIAILASIVHSKRCRKQMVAAGACGYLQKLVEMGVEGAKKLLESLSRGKLWGVFARR
ncbi:Armadillo [Dillenia turbinata]|uniref:Armadillo n=1 Tax=Dillenia turbinata TaxID=194707 RepID=A0AAN8Z4L9_9MAGN